MAFQLILGGSGSGKTRAMIGQINAVTAGRPDQNCFIIVPEQATASMQRALVKAREESGILHTDVVSFARLAHRIFEEQGALSRVILDDVGKNLLLRRALSTCADDLTMLGSAAGKPGTISEIKSILSEFMQYDIDEDDLDDLIGSLDTPSDSLTGKLRDLRRLYTAFREGMGERYLTKEEQLSVLAALVPRSDILAGSVIALDGFTGLTPVQVDLMRELAKVCDQIFVTVTLPEREERTYHDPYELFGMSKRFCTQMAHIAEETGCGMEEPVITDFRSEDKKEIISFLETNLFRDSGAVFPAEEGQQDLQIFACANRREECVLAAKKALELLHGHDWHYRDLAVIVSDMDAYADPLTETFARYDIPYFLDYKHHVMDNAFVEYLRSFLEIELSDYAAGPIMRFLRTGFGPLESDAVDRLDNVVTARGIRGYRRWAQSWEEEEADQARASLMARLAAWHEQARGQRTVTAWTQALYQFMEDDQILPALRRLAGRFAFEGDGERAQEYGQVYTALIHLMDQFTELVGDETVSLSEYAQMLDAGLEEIKVGVLPDTRDDILIGDLTRTRLEDVKAVLILGAGAEHLPGDTGRKGLLSRWDREVFAAAGMELSPGAKEQIYAQQFYLYQLLSKPTDYLALTFPRTTGKGDPEEPSYLVEEVKRITGVSHTSGTAYLGGPEGVSAPYAADYLFAHLQEQITGSARDGLWMGLYKTLEEEPEAEPLIRTLREASVYHRHAAWLADETVSDLYGTGRMRSISQLQQYAECPYKHFLNYGLRLQERDVYEFKVSDFGTVFHAAIENYGNRVKEAGLRWQDVSEEQRRQWIDETVLAAAVENGYDILQGEARNAYRLQQIHRLMARSVDVITQQLAAGDFEPWAYELNFGSGVIDRLDLAEIDGQLYVKVLDYKTGSQKLDLNKEYYGLQIQLPVYMAQAVDLLEQEQDHPVVPAAMFYYTVDDPFIEVETGKPVEDAMREKLRVDGVLSDDEAVLNALDGSRPSKSLAAPFGIKTDGGVRKSKSVLTPGEMDTVIAYGRHIAGQTNEKIAAGQIAVSPYKLDTSRGCQYCPYNAICHFDAKLEGYRKLDKMDSEEALRRMREEVGR